MPTHMGQLERGIRYPEGHSTILETYTIHSPLATSAKQYTDVPFLVTVWACTVQVR